MDVEAKRKLLEKTKRALDGCVIVVEGKRDERALRESGLAPNAETVKCGGKNAFATARQALENKEKDETNETKKRIVVLTDFDAEGERRAAEINEALASEGNASDASVRRDFRRLLGARCVEDAPSALERLEDELEKKIGKNRKKKK